MDRLAHGREALVHLVGDGNGRGERAGCGIVLGWGIFLDLFGDAASCEWRMLSWVGGARACAVECALGTVALPLARLPVVGVSVDHCGRGTVTELAHSLTHAFSRSLL